MLLLWLILGYRCCHMGMGLVFGRIFHWQVWMLAWYIIAICFEAVLPSNHSVICWNCCHLCRYCQFFGVVLILNNNNKGFLSINLYILIKFYKKGIFGDCLWSDQERLPLLQLLRVGIRNCFFMKIMVLVAIEYMWKLLYVVFNLYRNLYPSSQAIYFLSIAELII